MTDGDLAGAAVGLLGIAITADIASKVLGKSKKKLIVKPNKSSQSTGGKFKW